MKKGTTKKTRKSKFVYILRKCNKDMTSYNGTFKYPKKGKVECKDWNSERECGHGLHGLLWGSGNFDLEGYGELFQVIRVNPQDGLVDLIDKVKFRKGYVVLTTKSMRKAIKLIKQYAPKDTVFNYDTDDRSTANQGYSSTANQGDSSTANQGYRSTANQGDSSTANQGYRSTANQGESSTANQGYRSTANQGESSTANQGESSTANQGDWSTATLHLWGDHNQVVYRNNGQTSAVILFNHDTREVKVLTSPKNYQQNETIYIKDMKIKYRYTDTPESIKSLKEHEVFVFGSNIKGNHAGGVARLAVEEFGAVEGQGEGLQGQSYAFPTLNEKMKKYEAKDLKVFVDNLVRCANDNTTKIFLVTKIGCGIAGYSEEFMKELFNRSDISANIILPKGWR